MAELVIEGAEGAGEHDLAGAGAHRLVDRELAVRLVLAHRVADDARAARARVVDGLRRQRVEVAHQDVGHDAGGGEKRAAPPSAATTSPAASGQRAVEPGVRVLAVEEDVGEWRGPASPAGASPPPRSRQPAASRAAGNAAS